MECDCIFDDLGYVTGEMRNVLDKVLLLYEETPSISEFVNHKINLLWPIMGLYCEAFRKIGVTSRASFEHRIEHNYRYAKIRDAFEELLSVEEDLTAFLDRVDARIAIRASASKLWVGDVGPLDVPIINANTDDCTTLRALMGANYTHVVLLRHYA